LPCWSIGGTKSSFSMGKTKITEILHVCCQTPHVCWVNITSSMLVVGFLPQLMARPGDSSGGTRRRLHLGVCLNMRAWFWGHSHQTRRFIYISYSPKRSNSESLLTVINIDKLLFYLWVVINIGVLLLLSNWMCLKIWYSTHYGSSKKETDDQPVDLRMCWWQATTLVGFIWLSFLGLICT
jgi:hypothetical protein